jgi:hypothetical protein
MREDSSLNQLTSQSLHLVNPARYSDAHAGQNIFTSGVTGNLRGSVDCLRDLRLSSRIRGYRCMQRPDVFPAPPRPPTSRYTRWHALQAFVRSSVNSERASLFFVCASRYDRLATEII